MLNSRGCVFWHSAAVLCQSQLWWRTWQLWHEWWLLADFPVTPVSCQAAQAKPAGMKYDALYFSLVEVESLHYGITGHLKCLWQQKRQLSPKQAAARNKGRAHNAHSDRHGEGVTETVCEKYRGCIAYQSLGGYIQQNCPPLLRTADRGGCSAPAEASCTQHEQFQLSISENETPQEPYGFQSWWKSEGKTSRFFTLTVSTVWIL